MIITIIGIILFILIISACCCSNNNTSNRGNTSTRTPPFHNKTSNKSKRISSNNGGYCSNDCIHFRKEYLDDYGSPIAEANGNLHKYCALGYPLGGVCDYYEKDY